MKKSLNIYFLSACILFLSHSQTFAREATILFQNHQNKNNSTADQKGIWLADLASETYKRIYSNAVTGSCFSPDGRNIAFVENDYLYIMRNDGNDVRKIVGGNEWWINYNSLFTVNVIKWTTRGIFWIADNKLLRYIPETNQVETVIELTEIGDICDQGKGGGDALGTVDKSTICMSADGLRLWSGFTARPKDFSNVDVTANEAKWLRDKGYTTDILTCDVEDRGVKAFVQFSPDYSNFDVVWDHHWGHGNTMTAEGHVMLVDFGYHRELCIFDKQQGTVVDSITAWRSKNTDPKNLYDPQYPTGWEARPIEQVVNNDSLIIAFSRCKDGKGCSSSKTRAFIVNWRADTFEGEFELPGDGSWMKEFSLLPAQGWDGPLPAATTTPYVSIDKKDLIFVSDGNSTPAAQTVTIANTGVGTLAAVNATAAPAVPWLTVTVHGGGGNTQTITNTINPALLSSDMSKTTVTVKGGGASNETSYVVTVYKGSVIAAPSSFAVNASGDSLLDVTLSWTDNAVNEHGYCIERKTLDGAFIEIGRTNADANTYTDLHRDYGVTYVYRIRGYSDLGTTEQYSEYSAEQQISISGVPWIRITSPANGSQIKAGDPITITWESNLISNVYIEYAQDASSDYTTITKTGGIVSTSVNWQNFTWTTPIAETNEAYIAVVEYGNPDMYAEVGPLTISSDVAILHSSRLPRNSRRYTLGTTKSGGLVLQSHNHEELNFSICNAQGRVVAFGGTSGGNNDSKYIKNLSAGLYLVDITNKSGKTLGSEKIVIRN